MSGVPRTRIRPRSRLAYLTALLAVVGQLGAMWLAPLAEAHASHSASPNAPAHVETGGTQHPQSHDPHACAACLLLQQTAVAPHEPVAEPIAAERRAPEAVEAPYIAAPIRAGPRNPRAPPSSRVAIA